MAESSADSEGNGGSWWGSWIQAAKEKSAGALEFVKKDLAEFTTTMQRDTTTAVQATSSTLQDTFKPENTEAAKDKMKQSINGFFDGLTKALTIPPEDQDVSKTRPRDLGSGAAIYDRSKARLHAVQVDPDTYLKKPSGAPEQFEKWLETFSLEGKKGDISELLVVKVEVRALYTKLVPSEMSHSEFWQRYFYKLHQLQQDEARKQALMKRAETPTEIDSLGWEDDWSGDECEEFEKVTASEVKEIRQDDVQSRLVPDQAPDSTGNKNAVNQENESEKRPSTEERLPNKTQTDFAPPKEDVNKRTENSDLVSTDTNKSTLPQMTTCDSSDTKEKLTSTEKTEEDQAEFISSNKEDKPEISTSPKEDSEKAEVAEPKVPLTPKEEPKLPLTSKEEPKLPLTSKETDLLAAKSKTQEQPVQKVMPPSTKSEDVCNEIEESKVKVETDKADNSKSDCVEDGEKDIKTKVKGDMVVVGSDRESPTSDSSGYKEPSVDDDWEQDFDVDLTEEQKKAYEDHIKKMGDNLDNQEDDWESWE